MTQPDISEEHARRILARPAPATVRSGVMSEADDAEVARIAAEVVEKRQGLLGRLQGSRSTGDPRAAYREWAGDAFEARRTAFLLARIAEDEADARADAELYEHRGRFVDTDHMVRWDGERVLAECAFKRKVVEGMRDGTIDDMFAPEILGAMAVIYADHPDYREEWEEA